MSAQMPAQKRFSSSILLWVRADQPRQTGMNYWRGPHSGIIAATPGLREYRQIHLAEANPGRWPETPGVETQIPADRKVDGVAEVTFRSALAPLLGRKQTALAYQDEVNVFRRTLMYAGLPGSSRWYDVAASEERIGARALIYLRRKDGVSGREFRRLIRKQLPSALLATPLRELRTQDFLPWSERTWATPKVAHDNPKDQRFHASVMLGFADDDARDTFYAGAGVLNELLAQSISAIHAYDVSAALTFVKNGGILSRPIQ